MISYYLGLVSRLCKTPNIDLNNESFNAITPHLDIPERNYIIMNPCVIASPSFISTKYLHTLKFEKMDNSFFVSYYHYFLVDKLYRMKNILFIDKAIDFSKRHINEI